MFSPRIASFIILGAFVASTTANFLYNPGGENLWWVSNSSNNIAFYCNINPLASQYTVLLNHPTFTSPQALVAVLQNADCTHTIDATLCDFPSSTNYTVLLADTLNNTNVYATSSPFEIKAQGSQYPPASNTPTDGLASSTGTVSGSSTVSGSGSSSSPTSTAKSNSALPTFKVSAAGVLAAIGVAVGML
ncbi:hypothetical protein BC827DRAFT_231491 [Russula dissimulans]|nr:hypothetical protein BC827DRAFT_231491 [Russula dissimulans]